MNSQLGQGEGMALAALPPQAFLRHVCTSLSAPSPQAHEAGTMTVPFKRCDNSSSEQGGTQVTL